MTNVTVSWRKERRSVKRDGGKRGRDRGGGGEERDREGESGSESYESIFDFKKSIATYIGLLLKR